MLPKFASELRKLNHTRFNKLVSRPSLKFADEFQGRDISADSSESAANWQAAPRAARHHIGAPGPASAAVGEEIGGTLGTAADRLP
jgi:hypothetical protein